MTNGSFRQINGNPIMYTDPKGVTHSCEGSNIHRGIRLIWTDCQKDVPANAAHTGGNAVVNCELCQEPKP